MSISLYHNPRCSKSRETLALLQQQGITPIVVEYLKTPPTRQQLLHIIQQLNIAPRDLLRRNEAEYKALNLKDTNLSDDQLIDAMLAHPRLIERPIVLANNKAAIGRPPEAVLEIL